MAIFDEVDVVGFHSRAATTLLQNSTLEFAPTLQPILKLILPFIREHTPVQD